MSKKHNYDEYYILETMGQGQIGLCTCKRCGAVILIGKNTDDDGVLIHNKWHEKGKDPLPTSKRV